MKSHYRQIRHTETLFDRHDNRDEFVAAILVICRGVREWAPQLALVGLFVLVWAVVFMLALH
ncbi:MAG TPA: hypothetical protein VG815_17405 [Chloroflexota bacterium]|jgi:hypothetical protein|nr:hypothetical protein [Chloroflexota bacterium]